MTNPTIVPKRMPVRTPSYPAQGAPYEYDKTGTQYQVQIGNLNKTAPWGLYLFRIKPNGTPEQLFYVADSNGDLAVINGKLIVRWCDGQWAQWYAEVPGFIPFDDEPSGTVVNVNEAAMAVYKQQVALAQNTANNAMAKADAMQAQVTNLQNQVRTLENTTKSLQAQITAMQTQIIPRSEIEDIVWAKIWDVNYLIRLGFLQGSSPIQQVQDYLNDLTVFIKRIVGR